jgi:hypothetical protein
MQIYMRQWVIVPYNTDEFARLVEAFKSGRVSTADMHYRGCSVSSTTTSVVIIQQRMSGETHRITNELAEYTRISRSTVLQIL